MNNVYKIAKSNHNIVWYIFMTVIMFCLTYKFRLAIIGLPDQLPSDRTAAIVLYVYFIINALTHSLNKFNTGASASTYYRRLVWTHILIFIYMLCIYLSIGVNEGEHMVVVLINFFFTSLIPIYVCSKIFNNLDEFLYVILTATLLQTICIWIATIFPGIGIIIDHLFNNSEYYENLRDGYAGGIGCITAPGYLRYSLGQIACFYFYISRKRIWYLVLYIVFLITGSMVARTGLFVGSIGLLFIIIFMLQNKRIGSIVSISFTAISILITANLLLSNNMIHGFFTERYQRMNNLFETGQEYGIANTDFFDAYFHGKRVTIPPLTIETMIGTGVPSGIAGNGIKVDVDGEIIRLYVAYGLILTIMFYLFLWGGMLRASLSQQDNVVKYTMLLTLVFLIFAEFKEWIIYTSPFLLIFTDTFILASRQNSTVIDSHTSRE